MRYFIWKLELVSDILQVIVARETKQRQKKFDYYVMSVICDIFGIFPIYGKLGTIRKPVSGRIVCKTYIFINSNLLSCKTENRTKKSRTEISHYCFE